MALAPRPVTLEEFLRLPEEKPAFEFEDGRIIQKVSPKGRHSSIQATITEFVNHFGRSRRVAFAFPELRTTFAGHSHVPDSAIYRWQRIPKTSEGTICDDFLVPPDVAVEIASPDQSVNALVRRCLWYVANGVGAALLVDQTDRSVLIFRAEHLPRILLGADRIDLSDVLPGFDIIVQDVFDSAELL